MPTVPNDPEVPHDAAVAHDVLIPHDIEEFDPDLAPVQLVQAIGLSKARRVVQILSNFLLGQGAAQGLSVLAGLVLVHRLSVEAYAQFGLATAFQGVFTVLMDLGFASTIIPLVGDRRDDPALVGRYVHAAKRLRDRTFFILAPVAALAFLAVMHKHHWSWHVQALLLASVLLSLYSGGVLSIFSTPLFLFGRLRSYYVPQVISGVGRLLAYGALILFGGLNAWTAAGLAALNITFNGILVRRAGQKLFSWPAGPDKSVDRELVKYILPASPAIIFSAFQAQITVFLVSIFGGLTNIAEVSALSRIGQLFSVLVTFNIIVVEPYIARHSVARLLRTFCTIVLLTCLACMPVVLVAFLRPSVFLWIIGFRYAAITGVIGWYILGACMNFIANLIWIMNRARKWVFWSGSIVEVALLLGVQIAYLATVGVNNTRQAVFFNLASSCCYLLAHGYVTVVGFRQQSRQVHG